MTTTRQIERLWKSKSFPRLVAGILSGRPEAGMGFELELGKSVAAAALAVIRLDELNQSYTAICGELIRHMLAKQEADGGWGDVMTTAMCLRALSCGHGHGVAINRGLEYLGNLQRIDGLWPAVPIRRLPGDARATAFVMLQLAGHAQFHQAIRVELVSAWFEENEEKLDPAVRRLWSHARLRCGSAPAAESRLFAPRLTLPEAAVSIWS